MVTYYVYSLSTKKATVYVGVSVNPAVRLLEHLHANYCELGKVLNKVPLQEISINILEVVKVYKNRVSKELSQVEFYWVNKLLIEGHPLKNKVIKTTSSLKVKPL